MDNDYEIVFLAQEKDEVASNILYNKYKIFLKSKSKKYYNFLRNFGLDFDDVFQEILVAFEVSINKFNQEYDASFFTFLTACVEKHMISICRKYSSEKYKVLNEALYFDNDDEYSLLDIIGDNNTPEVNLLVESDLNLLYKNINNKLTFYESVVFDLKINGFEYQEISDILDINIKSVYNYIRSIKLKIKSNCNI